MVPLEKCYYPDTTLRWGCGSYSLRAASWRGASVARISSSGALWNSWDIGGSA
jgi:hypothetical protein